MVISLEVVPFLPPAGNVYKTPPKACMEGAEVIVPHQRAAAMGDLEGVYQKRVNFLKFWH